MPLTKSKLASNNRYLATRYEIVSIKTRRDERMNARLDEAARRKGTSKRDYILTALKAKLDADGVMVEDVSEFENETNNAILDHNIDGGQVND